MTIDEYAEWTDTTAVYPEAGTGSVGELSYLTLGLTGESGEIANKIKKFYRDGKLDRDALAKELGDDFWYLVRLCRALGFKPSEVLAGNRRKLTDRAERGVLRGEGDNR